MEEYSVTFNGKQRTNPPKISAENISEALEIAKEKYPQQQKHWNFISVRLATERDGRWKQ